MSCLSMRTHPRWDDYKQRPKSLADPLPARYKAALSSHERGQWPGVRVTGGAGLRGRSPASPLAHDASAGTERSAGRIPGAAQNNLHITPCRHAQRRPGAQTFPVGGAAVSAPSPCLRFSLSERHSRCGLHDLACMTHAVRSGRMRIVPWSADGWPCGRHDAASLVMTSNGCLWCRQILCVLVSE
jgi:hypothetical protein